MRKKRMHVFIGDKSSPSLMRRLASRYSKNRYGSVKKNNAPGDYRPFSDIDCPKAKGLFDASTRHGRTDRKNSGCIIDN